jgi:hypothetical protein
VEEVGIVVAEGDEEDREEEDGAEGDSSGCFSGGMVVVVWSRKRGRIFDVKISCRQLLHSLPVSQCYILLSVSCINILRTVSSTPNRACE